MTHQTTLLETAQQIRNEYPLCDSCLGRLFREIQDHSSNQEKGEYLRSQLSAPQAIDPQNCWLCEGLTEEISSFCKLIKNKLQDYEYSTFVIGSKIDEDIINKEQQLWEHIGSESEPIKMEINREIGKQLEHDLKKTVDFEHPEIMVILDTTYNDVFLQIEPLYLYGRYRKVTRGIPQTRWPCHICRGIGCRACDYTGTLYADSVEELIAAPALNASQATEESFHGCGREDIDALMLGTGRPFVLELKNPRIRTLDLSLVTKRINTQGKQNIEVSDLRYSEKKEIARLKSATFAKTYRVVIEGDTTVPKEKLKEVAQILRGTTLQQFTPTRVAHRRANKVRERQIYNCTVESVEGAIATLTLETESGTYIKELVSGDSGRTTPNMSTLLGIPCTVKELDVLEIKGE